MTHNARVLQDVDDSIRAFLRTYAHITNDIDIVFDAPTRDWAARRNSPGLDIFLYDIRENLDRRQALMEDSRDPEGFTARRPFATRWYNVSYLITAWTQRPEDEHRLLGSVLLGFLETHALPPDILVGSLAEMERQVFLTIGRPLAQERSISDIWSALGGELKPSLDLVLVVPFEPTGGFPFGPPVLEAPSIGVGGPGSEAPGETEVGGRTEGHRRAKAGPVGRPAWEPRQRRGRLVDERADAPSEEAIGGTTERPGRRFRFAVHEPSSAPRPSPGPSVPPKDDAPESSDAAPAGPKASGPKKTDGKTDAKTDGKGDAPPKGKR